MNKVILFTVLVFSFMALADDKQLIHVDGKCTKTIIPDRVKVSITVEILDDDQKVSTQKANKKYNEILNSYKALKLKDAEFETTDYRIFPFSTYENRKNVFKGYKTRIGFSVSTSEVSKTGDMLNLGHVDGQDYVSGPNSFVSNELYKKTYLECLKTASVDGQNKAEILAKANGHKLGKLVSIIEGSESMRAPSPPMAMYKSMSLAESATAQIEVGKTDVNVAIKMSFEMK